MLFYLPDRSSCILCTLNPPPSLRSNRHFSTTDSWHTNNVFLVKKYIIFCFCSSLNVFLNEKMSAVGVTPILVEMKLIFTYYPHISRSFLLHTVCSANATESKNKYNYKAVKLKSAYKINIIYSQRLA